MQNVIPIKRETNESTPDDLMTVSAFAKKHGTSVSYIYKLFYEKKIKMYKRGYWKVSESSVLSVLDK